MGRETRVDNPDGTFATRAYTPGLVTLTDERSKVRRKFIDAYGRLDTVEEVNGSETYTTTYDYDAAGALIKLTNHLNHNTLMAYDLLGRKIAMCDPNMGTPPSTTVCTTATAGAWVYTYNLAGDLLTQKDAKNQTLTFTRDESGRPKDKKNGTTTLVTWTYDELVVPFSKGQLTRVVDQSVDTLDSATTPWAGCSTPNALSWASPIPWRRLTMP